MSTNSIEVQLLNAKKMKEMDLAFAGELRKQMNYLSEMLENFCRAGFPIEVKNYYQARYLEPEQETIEALCKRMENEHKEYLEKLIKVFEEILAKTN